MDCETTLERILELVEHEWYLARTTGGFSQCRTLPITATPTM